jgi:hypothetical protein
MALRRFAVQFGLRAQAPVADLAASWGRAFATVLPELKYAKSHEWAKAQGDVAVVGISDHAQVCAHAGASVVAVAGPANAHLPQNDRPVIRTFQ